MNHLSGNPTETFATCCYDSIDELPATSLFSSAARSFFMTRRWFEILEKTTRTDQDRFFYLVVEIGAEPIALMALRSPAGQLGASLQGQDTGPGSIAALTNWYTSSYDILISPQLDDHRVIMRALVAELRKRLAKAAVIEFNYLDENAETTGLLISTLRSTGLITLSYRHHLVRYEDVSSIDFKTYLRQRSLGIRKEYARKGRRLEEKFQLDQIVYRDRGQLDKALQDYQTVYEKSWKQPERFPDYIPELFRHGLTENWLRVAVLYLDDQPVATEIHILFNGQATSYKGAYDPTYRKYSPASVLRIFVIQYLMEVDKVREMDMGYGDQPYKKSWLSRGRWLTGVVAFNPWSFTGLKQLSSYQGRKLMKAAVKIKQCWCPHS